MIEAVAAGITAIALLEETIRRVYVYWWRDNPTRAVRTAALAAVRATAAAHEGVPARARSEVAGAITPPTVARDALAGSEAPSEWAEWVLETLYPLVGEWSKPARSRFWETFATLLLPQLRRTCYYRHSQRIVDEVLKRTRELESDLLELADAAGASLGRDRWERIADIEAAYWRVATRGQRASIALADFPYTEQWEVPARDAGLPFSDGTHLDVRQGLRVFPVLTGFLTVSPVVRLPANTRFLRVVGWVSASLRDLRHVGSLDEPVTVGDLVCLRGNWAEALHVGIGTPHPESDRPRVGLLDVSPLVNRQPQVEELAGMGVSMAWIPSKSVARSRQLWSAVVPLPEGTRYVQFQVSPRFAAEYPRGEVLTANLGIAALIPSRDRFPLPANARSWMPPPRVDFEAQLQDCTARVAEGGYRDCSAALRDIMDITRIALETRSEFPMGIRELVDRAGQYAADATRAHVSGPERVRLYRELAYLERVALHHGVSSCRQVAVVYDNAAEQALAFVSETGGASEAAADALREAADAWETAALVWLSYDGSEDAAREAARLLERAGTVRRVAQGERSEVVRRVVAAVLRGDEALASKLCWTATLPAMYRSRSASL